MSEHRWELDDAIAGTGSCSVCGVTAEYAVDDACPGPRRTLSDLLRTRDRLRAALLPEHRRKP